jgi:hypothetical protein
MTLTVPGRDARTNFLAPADHHAAPRRQAAFCLTATIAFGALAVLWLMNTEWFSANWRLLIRCASSRRIIAKT